MPWVFKKTRKEEKQFTFSTALPFFSVGIAAGLFVGLTNFWSEDVKILHFAKMHLFQVALFDMPNSNILPRSIYRTGLTSGVNICPTNLKLSIWDTSHRKHLVFTGPACPPSSCTPPIFDGSPPEILRQRCICLLKMNISAQPLKMALHKNVGVKAGHMVIFLHEKVILLHGSKIRQFFSARWNNKLASDYIMHWFCPIFWWSLEVWIQNFLAKSGLVWSYPNSQPRMTG